MSTIHSCTSSEGATLTGKGKLTDSDKTSSPIDSKSETTPQTNRSRRYAKASVRHSQAYSGPLNVLPTAPIRNPPKGILISLTNRPLEHFNEMEGLPALDQVSSGKERLALFRSKLAMLGQVVIDPRSTLFAHQREVKRETLKECCEYFLYERTITDFTAPFVQEMLTLVIVHVFRDTGVKKPMIEPISGRIVDERDICQPELSCDDEDSLQEMEWVMNVFLRLVSIIREDNMRMFRTFVTSAFISRLVELFQSDDYREREFLRPVLHRIYGRMMPQRRFIRTEIGNFFLCYVYGYKCSNGISELLEVLNSIVNGFAQPLKREHIDYLQNILLPLHRQRGFPIYSQGLKNCMIQYIIKAPACAPFILSELISSWPKSNHTKELCFLEELEDVLVTIEKNMSLIDDELLQRIGNQIASCMKSVHYQVAERTLYFWHPKSAVPELVIDRWEYLLPEVLNSLYKNNLEKDPHWNQLISSLTMKVSGMIKDGFEECRKLEVYQRIEAAISKGHDEQISEIDKSSAVWEMLAHQCPSGVVDEVRSRGWI